jgi:hypothetical protein
VNATPAVLGCRGVALQGGLRAILPAMKEAWEFNAFVRLCNQSEKERSGWMWPGEPPEQKLRDGYRELPVWKTLGDFARTRYRTDQEA